MNDCYRIRIGEEVVKVRFASTFPIGVLDQFINLDDVPDSYVGQGHLTVRVNDAEDGLEFHKIGLGDLEPKHHSLLDGLGEDDHLLYLRADGDREITGTLKPSTDGTLSFGADDRHFNVGFFRQIRSNLERLDLYNVRGAGEGAGTLDLYANAVDGGQLLLRARSGSIADGDVRIIPGTSGIMSIEGDAVMQSGKIFDWRNAVMKPKILVGGTQPSIPVNSEAYWYDNVNDQLWKVLNLNGVYKKVELNQ